MMKLIAATRNMGKLREFRRILGGLPVMILSAEEAGVVGEAEETGETFAENARLKAEYVCKQTGLPAFADDSGLCVAALSGAPGVHTARFAGEHATDDQNIDRLLEVMREIPKGERGAYFAAAICCAFPGGERIETEGVCPGEIGFSRVGDGGFGYDPIFMVGDESFSSLPGEKKDEISHRGKALGDFAEALSRKLAGDHPAEGGI